MLNGFDPTPNASEAISGYYETGGEWYFSLETTMGFNHSNPLFHQILTYGFGTNDSVVINSIYSSTNAISYVDSGLASVKATSSPFAYIPTSNSPVIMLFRINVNRYVGPLVIDIKATSPGKVLILKTSYNVVYDQTNNNSTPTPVYFKLTSLTSLPPSYLGSLGIFLPGQTLFLKGILSSRDNFILLAIRASSPFNITGSNSSKTSFDASTGIYTIGINVLISTPQYSYNGQLNVTLMIQPALTENFTYQGF